MLTRAARRRQALRCVDQAAERIQLPWLCPALNRTSSNTQIRTSSTRPSLPRSTSLPTKVALSRNLASAASVADDFDRRDEYLPFAYERHGAASAHTPEQKSFYDLSNILMIDQTVLRTPEAAKHRRIDLRGNASEVEATLEACLQVQRWDRAFKILAQLDRIYAGDTIKLQQIYNRVLEAMVFDLIWNRDNRNRDKINQWIEVYMRRAGVEPTAQTFALKIKVAMATLQGSRRDRTVTRYWDMAKTFQFENQVASMRDILSDTDLGKLSEICPLAIDFELEPDSVPKEQDIKVGTGSVSIDTTSKIRETDQKGLGLVSLRQALALFRDPKYHSTDPAHLESLRRLRQSKLEKDSLQSAIERWRVEHEKRMKMGVSGIAQQGKIGALSWQWHERLTAKLEKELAMIEEAETSTKVTTEQRLRCEYGPFLRLLTAQQLAALTTLSSINFVSRIGTNSSIKLSKFVIDIGKSVEAEIEAQQTKARKSVKKAKPDSKNKPKQSLAGDLSGPDLHHSALRSHLNWSVAIYAKVGAVLCDLFFEGATMTISKRDPSSGQPITISEPVFQRQNVFVHGRKISCIGLLPEFRELMAKEPPPEVLAKQLPMISTPKPWTAYAEGGYMESNQPFLRIKHEDIAQRDYAKAAAERGDLDQIFAGLDVLGSTGWKVNREVFNVMLEAWNSGQAVANLPPVEKVFPEHERPKEDASAIEKWRYYSKIRAIENERGGLHSNRCFQNFQMEIAQSYLDETFYLPHNVDFRGRAYPIPPYLNQMGADNARGLLLFAEGRPLGSRGLKWLQVHLANVYGYDKASLTDRAQFAVDHLDDMRDSVNNPLEGKRWWLQAEDPWQCLATCHEILKALELPDPSKFVSHLPVHQDGTCNGLQHYAALGGDIAGARQVNLEPGDRPADVYTGVAELVKSEIRQDAEDGLEIAKLLDGRLTRKIVKQTVMTNVYGVTFTGAIRQVRKQLDDLMSDLNRDGKAGQAATYIARKIFKGLGTLFEGAHEIQYWLGDCANRITHSVSAAQLKELEQKEFDNVRTVEKKGKISKKGKTNKMIDATDFRSTVIWTTPLKLPVVQPYRVNIAEYVETNASKMVLSQPSVTDAVDPRKQLQGFPPNFVHSLDATHMMLSASKANELGLTFSAVHDSFWTHAADVDQLNVLLREAFIRMHGEDIIGRLAAEFRARYKGHWYLARVGSKNILGRKIRQYRIDHSNHKSDLRKQRYEELIQEVKRMRLLASEDPLERAQGQKMVTPATLFEELNGDQYLAQKVSLGQTALGEVPDVNPIAVGDALHAEEGYDVNIEHALEPSLDSEAELASTKSRRSTTKKKDPNDSVWLWLPISFRDVPKKGNFDVERLRNSTYFFS